MNSIHRSPALSNAVTVAPSTASNSSHLTSAPKPTAPPASEAQADNYKAIIFGSGPVLKPTESLSLQARKKQVDAYADRIKLQIANIEVGSEGERNTHFQQTRQFLEPSGYFSGGLLAAGYDPHEKITVTFNSYTGMGKPTHLTSSEKRTYYAWEIAAGALAHDKVERGGPINFQSMDIERKDKGKINELEAVGKNLQDHWEADVSSKMRDESSSMAKRSGSADAYAVRATLQSLRSDLTTFSSLSPAGQAAVTRTLEYDGQVIVPNIYGYPLSGYAFIPYTPYDGDYEKRPNKGLMIDLKNGTVTEINGDDDFANWAKNNQGTLQKSFNARDLQGGKDAHWPNAGNVLHNLIYSKKSTYPGYETEFKDRAVPVRETFNYTYSRAGDYTLKYSPLSNIHAHYQEVNAKNAVWSDQTQVFGSSQQNWKNAKDFWGNTFGYFPIVGNTGNIVFGVHDSIYGKTAEDRVGGASAAVISGLLLVHELEAGVDVELTKPAVRYNSAARQSYRWKLNPQTQEIEFTRAPQVVPTVEKPVAFAGMREIEMNGRSYFVADKPDAGDGQHYLLRVRHPEDPNQLASSGIIAKPDEKGVWQRRGIEGGGKWPWERTPSPTPSNDLKTPPKLSDGFDILGDPKTSGAAKFDEVFKYNSETSYQQSVSNFKEGDVAKRKLTLSWTVEDNSLEVSPREKAAPNELSTTHYSEPFMADLSRDRYTVRIKQPDGFKTVELNGSGPAHNETLSIRLKQFEAAIPDANMRSRISEVAHQGTAAKPLEALHFNHIQDNKIPIGEGTHYIITYDPATNEAELTVNNRYKLIDMEHDGAVIPNTEATTQRTVTIRESNELEKNANPYTVDPHAPFTLTTSVITEVK